MSGLGQYLSDIVTGAWSLVAGMGVTIRYMFKPVATVQYPRKRLELPEAHRGHIELIPADSGHLCVACGECYRTCPSGVIKVQGLKAQASDHNRARYFFIDFSRCSLCGLCVEVCPENALRFSYEYEQAYTSRYGPVVDLMARLHAGGGA
jgi:formate hydrogenlyase subunit 6/NADH:ubiquinone oxidoreductase subunit I